MATFDKKKMLSALDGIDDDLGLRAGRDALANPHGTVATKAPQEPGGRDATGHASGFAEPTLATDRTPHDPHTGLAREDTAQHYQKMDGAGGSAAPSAHVTSGPYKTDANQASGGGTSSPHAAVQSYLAQGYSPQDHAAHLAEHWDLPVSHMIGKHIKRGG